MVFSKIVKKLQLPDAYSMAGLEVYGSGRITLAQSSPTSLNPGDIVTFSYGRGFFSGSRRFLVVGTEKNPGGGFLSNRGNYLICGYDLTNRESLPGVTMVFNSFYKNRNSNYSRMKGTMASVFGVGAYKTFMASKIKSLFKVEVIK
jgi:hypothetical protein